jgi:predicted nuclease of predicted toxin-antitoxin system
MRLTKLLQQMRILLDENFPADFAMLLAGHDASNVHSHGWAGMKNGELLRRAHGMCEVFVTLDRNLEFQQNIKILSFGIVVVRARSNRIADLSPLIPNILQAANQVAPGRIVTVGA